MTTATATSTKFFATVLILRAQRAAVVTLTDASGAWCGSSRITSTSSRHLYDLGYETACQNAALKGGHVETYSREAA